MQRVVRGLEKVMAEKIDAKNMGLRGTATLALGKDTY